MFNYYSLNIVFQHKNSEDATNVLNHNDCVFLTRLRINMHRGSIY